MPNKYTYISGRRCIPNREGNDMKQTTIKERLRRAGRRYSYADFWGLPLRHRLKAWLYGFAGRGEDVNPSTTD